MITDELHDNSLTCWRVRRRAVRAGGPRNDADPHILVDELTLFKPGVADYAYHITTPSSLKIQTFLRPCGVRGARLRSAARRFCGCWRGIFIVGGPLFSAFSPPSWKTIIKCNLSERQQRSN